MSGRARARARGRARAQQATAAPSVGAATVQPAGHGTTRPEPPQSESMGEGLLIGRGRQRGGPVAPSHELAISAGFQEMTLGERGGCRRNYNDLGVNTRQSMEHVKDAKIGVSGNVIKLSTNHFRLTSRPQWALYQYHIDYNPQMESRRLRSALLFQHEDIIGRTRAFDGTILFLPKKMKNKVTEVVSQTRQGETVKVTITLTNELPSTSPTCLQFYNIIFKRLLKIMNLQQIGRNYYNPTDPISIPKHRYLASLEMLMCCVSLHHALLGTTKAQ